MARILVVDDKRAHRKFIADVLRLEGYEVSEAESGLNALEMLNQGRFDLITLDQQMPGMTGLECYKRMKHRLLRIMFITVFGDESGFVEVKKEGRPVLVKPLTPDQIVAAVRRILGEP